MKENMWFSWDEDTGRATCLIRWDDEDFLGEARCNPEDRDMMSKKTGQEIAMQRAFMKVLRHEKKQLRRELAALNSLYYSMKNSPRFNPKSYEAYSLYRQINIRKTDIADLKEQIDIMGADLRKYIADKDEMYKLIRRKRKEEAMSF